MRFTLEDIFNLSTAVIYYPDRYKSATSVSIDTRTIKKNSIYVAIKGKKFNGHDFVRDAINKGAGAIVVQNRKLKLFDDVEVPIISVKNTIDAYSELANIYRNKLNAKVISITGSNGKTTTKEMLAHILSAKFKVHKTIANNNNNIGVPLTILSAPKNSEVLVLEHGTNHFGEIEYTAKVAEPDISIITNIGDSHIQHLQSKQNVLREKKSLFEYTKDDGNIFINSDDSLLKSVKIKKKNQIRFGFKGSPDVKGKHVKSDHTSLIVTGFSKILELKTNILGEANKKNLLAAVAIALKLGLTKKDIIKQISSLPKIKGRLELINFSNFTIIDDTYNSNPNSVENAVKVLKSFKQRNKKVLVFGDMFELGEKSVDYHKQAGEIINRTKFDCVYTIGKYSKHVFDKLNQIKNKKHFSRRLSLSKTLENIEIENTVFLFKGSRGMMMEEFAEILKMRKN